MGESAHSVSRFTSEKWVAHIVVVAMKLLGTRWGGGGGGAGGDRLGNFWLLNEIVFYVSISAVGVD